jgi:C1A family cysteine protease
MIVYTDFLTYKEGLYHRTEDSFKFNGQHVVKIIGWEKNSEGSDYWIIENVWGEDWGENVNTIYFNAYYRVMLKFMVKIKVQWLTTLQLVLLCIL